MKLLCSCVQRSRLVTADPDCGCCQQQRQEVINDNLRDDINQATHAEAVNLIKSSLKNSDAHLVYRPNTLFFSKKKSFHPPPPQSYPNNVIHQSCLVVRKRPNELRQTVHQRASGQKRGRKVGRVREFGPQTSLLSPVNFNNAKERFWQAFCTNA